MHLRSLRFRPSVWTWMALYLVLLWLGSNGLWAVVRARYPSPQRNPFLRNGWKDFVQRAEPRRPEETLVVLISNSQGYVTSRRTHAVPVYAQHLERLRQASGRPVRVLNWSVVGGQYIDFLVLTAAARRLDPSALVLVLPPSVFEEPPEVKNAKSHWGADTFYLLSDRNIRRPLPDTVLTLFLDAGLRADIATGTLWPAWRMRQRPLAIAGRLTALHPFRARGGRAAAAPVPPRARPAPADGAETATLPRRPLNPDLAEAFLDQARAAAPDVVWVNMPLHSAWWTSPRPEAGPEIEALCRARGIRMENWVDRVPDELFISRAHFVEEGHIRVAEALFEVLR